jgi:outer membrane lipoprotein LolB
MSGCAAIDVAPDGSYSRAALSALKPLERWAFDGRLSLTGQKESWSASIAWEHTPVEEHLKLSGPLGQGATVIRLAGERATIDRGAGNVQVSTQPEAFINQQVGLSVPIKALRYWTIGLPDPEQSFVEIGSGFRQSGWLVEYKQMQQMNNRTMPRKMTVMNGQVKLKLIIDQWVF